MAPTLHLGRRARLAIKVGGYILLALIAFVFALQMTFDYDRVKDKYLVEGLASSYDVRVKSVSRGLMPGTFTMTRVQLISRTTKPDEVPTEIKFDTLDADVGVLGLIGGNLGVDFEGSIGKGTLAGRVEWGLDGKSLSVSATGSRINGDAIPQLKEWIGLPLLGKVDLAISLSVSANNYQKATGSIQISCPKGCTLGDGVTKFKPRVKKQSTATMMGEGIEWGRVEIDRMVGKIELKGGKVSVTKWEFESRDAELHVDLEMKTGKRLKDSELVRGCFRYKSLPALQAREPKTANAMQLIGGILGPDGLYHVKLECQGGGGKCGIDRIKARGKVCTGDATDESGGDVVSGKTVKPPSLGAVTTGSGTINGSGSGSAAPPTAEPGNDISPVPTFADAAPSEPAVGTPGSGSAGSGSAGSGSAGAGSGSGSPPTLGPGPAGGIERLPPPPDQPPPAGQEPPVESPPPVAPKENE
jgi:type II secretion system protein N